MTTLLTSLDDWMPVSRTAEAIPLDGDPPDVSNIAEQDRWTYCLQQLAKQGFKIWLREREPSLSVSDLDSGVTPNALLQVGSFRVCLIPTSLNDDEIAISQAATEQADSAAHFYVAIAVDEEAEVVSLAGFLPYNELTALCANIPLDIDQTYPIPTIELNPDLNALLLFLQCLSPSAISLPVRSSALSPEGSSLGELMGRVITNAGKWLQRQADEVMPHDHWQPIPAMSLRLNTSPSTVRSQLMAALDTPNSPTIPTESGIAYQTIMLGGCALNMFAAVWPLPDATGDWMLLTMLCPAPGQGLPPGLALVINEITPEQPRVELVRETLTNDDQRAALFAQVKGDHHDVFDITIVADNEQRWSAPIQFHPEA